MSTDSEVVPGDGNAHETTSPSSGDEKQTGNSQEWLDYMVDRSERGDTHAHFSLGQHYFEKKDYPNALNYFSMADKKGNLQATYQLAVMHYDGLGVAEDQHKGMEYMKAVSQATKKEHLHLVPSAQFSIGQAHFQGFGINQSDEEAVQWYMLAAKSSDQQNVGCIKAQNALGMLYSRKDSLSLQQAFHWHQKAAENGHLESMAALGQMLLCGHGCAIDKTVGVKWLKESSTRGCMYATGLLSCEYFNSKLYSRAVENALKICDLDQEAAQILQEQFIPHLVHRGIAISCFVLARCLQLGQGIERSEEKAKMYFDKASLFDKEITSDLHTKMTQGVM